MSEDNKMAWSDCGGGYFVCAHGGIGFDSQPRGEMVIDGKTVTRQHVVELMAERDALAATVEALQQSLLKCAELVNFDAGTAIDWLIDNCYALRRQAKATPQQHLCDVRADAIESALDYMYSNTSSGNSASDDFDLIRDYACSIRNAKDGE